MCLIFFIFHLVPLVLGSLFVCRKFSQKCTKQVHRRQMDVARGLGPTWPRWPMLGGIAQQPLALPCHWSLEKARWHPQEASHTIDRCRFDPKDEVKLPWIHGPTVIHLEGTNQPSYHLTCQSIRLTYMQPPSGAHPAPRWMEWWCKGRLADAPRRRPTPKAPQPTFLSAYK
jgi:hypothetical protein